MTLKIIMGLLIMESYLGLVLCILNKVIKSIILKIKKDKPTVIKVSGEEYVLRHKDQYRGGKRK